jgi:hypothetical protein
MNDISITARPGALLSVPHKCLGKRLVNKLVCAYAPLEPGIGIDWDWDAVKGKCVPEFTAEITARGE